MNSILLESSKPPSNRRTRTSEDRSMESSQDPLLNAAAATTAPNMPQNVQNVAKEEENNVDQRTSTNLSQQSKIKEDDSSRNINSRTPGRPSAIPQTVAGSRPPSSPQHSSPQHPPQSTSLSDQVLQSALQGTVEFLKLAGGLTLTATGKVVAPPLHVTRTLILPQLWAATVDSLSHGTPQRLQDWFRIVRSAVVQFVSVLTHTEQGQDFRKRFVLVLGDVLDCLSSDLTRQVLIDWTACSVKLGEALHTPEFERFLQQVAVLACRGIQALSSGRTQQLIHDFSRLTWSACALWADPQTVTALAEVTAYLCYALEMEDAVLDGAYQPKGATEEEMKKNKKSAAKRSARRKERDSYQKETNQNRNMLQNPSTSVEEAILSSLGGVSSPDNYQEGERYTDAASTVTSLPDDNANDVSSEMGSSTMSLRQQISNQSNSKRVFGADSSSWHDKAKKDVDVTFLRQQIGQRPSTRETIVVDNEEFEDAWLSDVEDGPSREIPDRNNRRTKQQALKLEDENQHVDQHEQDLETPTFVRDPQESPAPRERREGETPSQYFYRVLDDMLVENRAKGLDQIVDHADPAQLERRGNVRASQSQPDSIRKRLDSIRAELSKSSPPAPTTNRSFASAKPKSTPTFWRRYRWLIVVVLLSIVMAGTAGFGLACYGVYMIWTQHYSSPFYPPIVATNEPVVSAAPEAVTDDNEIVIRIVREVVHMDGQGKVLGKSPEATKLSRKRIDQISQCIANTV